LSSKLAVSTISSLDFVYKIRLISIFEEFIGREKRIDAKRNEGAEKRESIFLKSRTHLAWQPTLLSPR
jgi:hypothetical protein